MTLVKLEEPSESRNNDTVTGCVCEGGKGGLVSMRSKNASGSKGDGGDSSGGVVLVVIMM